MARLTAFLLIALLALVAGCGDDDDNDNGSSADGADTSKAAEYDRAVAAMKKDDFDTAIPAMEELGDFRDAAAKAEEFRVEAARKTLVNAKRKPLKTEPRAALSLAQTAQRYHPTPEANAFIAEAERAHAAFKRRGQDDD